MNLTHLWANPYRDWVRRVASQDNQKCTVDLVGSIESPLCARRLLTLEALVPHFRDLLAAAL